MVITNARYRFCSLLFKRQAFQNYLPQILLQKGKNRRKMKMRATEILGILLTFLLFLNTQSGFGFTIKLQKKIKLSQEKTLLQKAMAFCVTEDELFMITDSKSGDIKIYDGNGQLVNILGRKGFGPGEFGEPSFCFYNKGERKFGVFDYRIRKIFIYNRTGRTEFKRVREVYCLALGYDIQLKGNKLLISGYKPDPNKNPYDLYYVDLTNNQITFLLPSYYKYGLKSLHEYETQYRRKPDIKVIGANGWFDVQSDCLYFVWEGDLKIIKINIKSGKRSFFGKKSSHYTKPFASKRLLEAYRMRDINIMQNERSKMSFVTDIFASRKYTLLIYERPVKQDKKLNFKLQIYTLDGNFLEELDIPDNPGYKMCFDKNKGRDR